MGRHWNEHWAKEEEGDAAGIPTKVAGVFAIRDDWPSRSSECWGTDRWYTRRCCRVCHRKDGGYCASANRVRFFERQLAPLEQQRSSDAFYVAVTHLWRRIENGDQVTDPDVFAPEIGGRSRAQRMIEGALLKARDAFEEKKVPYIGRIPANWMFSGLSDAEGYLILRISGELTYRQLACLACVEHREEFNLGGLGGVNLRSIRTRTVLLEIYDLYQRGLLSKATLDGRHTELVSDHQDVIPGRMRLTLFGRQLYGLMDLEGMDAGEIKSLVASHIQEIMRARDMHGNPWPVRATPRPDVH